MTAIHNTFLLALPGYYGDYVIGCDLDLKAPFAAQA